MAKPETCSRMAAAPACEREHAVARPHVINARGAFKDDACNLQAWDERQFGFDLVFTFDHQDVGKIDARGLHLDAHLTVSEARAFNLCNLESTNAVERATAKCAHG
jgi:hypothetical protein